jgi:hypothetical protein
MTAIAGSHRIMNVFSLWPLAAVLLIRYPSLLFGVVSPRPIDFQVLPTGQCILRCAVREHCHLDICRERKSIVTCFSHSSRTTPNHKPAAFLPHSPPRQLFNAILPPADQKAKKARKDPVRFRWLPRSIIHRSVSTVQQLIRCSTSLANQPAES